MRIKDVLKCKRWVSILYNNVMAYYVLNIISNAGIYPYLAGL